MPLIEINNVVDDGPWFLAPIQCLRFKLHQFDLSLYSLQTWLYNILTTNRPSGAVSYTHLTLPTILRV